MQRDDLHRVAFDHLDQGFLVARDIRSAVLRRLFRSAFAALLGAAGRMTRLAGRALEGQPRPAAGGPAAVSSANTGGEGE